MNLKTQCCDLVLSVFNSVLNFITLYDIVAALPSSDLAVDTTLYHQHCDVLLDPCGSLAKGVQELCLCQIRLAEF